MTLGGGAWCWDWDICEVIDIKKMFKSEDTFEKRRDKWIGPKSIISGHAWKLQKNRVGKEDCGWLKVEKKNRGE